MRSIRTASASGYAACGFHRESIHIKNREVVTRFYARRTQ